MQEWRLVVHSSPHVYSALPNGNTLPSTTKVFTRLGNVTRSHTPMHAGCTPSRDFLKALHPRRRGRWVGGGGPTGEGGVGSLPGGGFLYFWRNGFKKPLTARHSGGEFVAVDVV